MIRISPNFANAFIFIRSMLGLLPSIFCLFVAVIAKFERRFFDILAYSNNLGRIGFRD